MKKFSDKQIIALLGISIGITAAAAAHLAYKLADAKLDILLKKLDMKEEENEENKAEEEKAEADKPAEDRTEESKAEEEKAEEEKAQEEKAEADKPEDIGESSDVTEDMFED